MISPDIPVDRLAGVVSPDTQKLAARMAQDAFAQVFRLTLHSDEAALQSSQAALETQCFNWSRAGQGEDARALRLALLIAGMDQWGLAYSQAFGLVAIPALSALLGNLRTRLDAASDARFQSYFSRLDEAEADAIDFKIELRRGIHMALWHAMAACEQMSEAEPIVRTLGSLLLALTQRMPQTGWRLTADALAHFQMRLLGNPAELPPLAQETTQQLFDALGNALDATLYRAIRTGADQSVQAWLRARNHPTEENRTER